MLAETCHTIRIFHKVAPDNAAELAGHSVCPGLKRVEDPLSDAFLHAARSRLFGRKQCIVPRPRLPVATSHALEHSQPRFRAELQCTSYWLFRTASDGLGSFSVALFGLIGVLQKQGVFFRVSIPLKFTYSCQSLIWSLHRWSYLNSSDGGQKPTDKRVLCSLIIRAACAHLQSENPERKEASSARHLREHGEDGDFFVSPHYSVARRRAGTMGVQLR